MRNIEKKIVKNKVINQNIGGKSMTTEEYIMKSLKNLSGVDRILANKIVQRLGEWSTVSEVAKYLKKHKNTIYEKVNENEVLSRTIGGRKLIYSASIIFLLREDH